MVEEIVMQRSTVYRLVVRTLLMLAMADGVGNNRLARQRLIDRGVARNIAFDKQTTQ
jgi:DNA phosphorothioation-dependent restriction protein DptG